MPVPFSYFHLLNLLISSTVFATGTWGDVVGFRV